MTIAAACKNPDVGVLCGMNDGALIVASTLIKAAIGHKNTLKAVINELMWMVHTFFHCYASLLCSHRNDAAGNHGFHAFTHGLKNCIARLIV